MPKVVPFAVSEMQSRFLLDPRFIRGFIAGRGAGKSFVGAADLIKDARAGDHMMAVSPSYVMLEDTTWPTFQQVAESMGCWIRGVKSPIPRAFIHTRDGGRAEVVFRSGERPDSLRGPSKSKLWFDEPQLMNEDVLKFGLPVLRHKGRMGRLTMTMTPRGRLHWTFNVFFHKVGPLDDVLDRPDVDELLERSEIYQGIVYEKRLNTSLFQCHTRDNPFLPPQFAEQMAGLYSASLAEQELAGQFVDLEGLLFNRDWFTVIEDSSKIEGLRVRYWDRAADYTGKGSETSGTRLLRTAEDHFCFEDVRHGHWSPAERDDIIEATAEQDAKQFNNQVIIYVEQEGGSGGKEVAHQLQKRLARFPVFVDVVSGRRHRTIGGVELPGEAKVVRAMPLASAAERGDVSVVRASWNPDALDQLAAFPESGMTDIVDSMSGAFNRASARVGGEYKSASVQKRETTPERFGKLLLDLKAQQLKKGRR